MSALAWAGQIFEKLPFLLSACAKAMQLNPFCGLRAARPTEVPKAFGAYTHSLSVAPLESKPFEAPVVVAVGRAFVFLAPGFRSI